MYLPQSPAVQPGSRNLFELVLGVLLLILVLMRGEAAASLMILLVAA